ncbi:vesicle-trafficking protein SEC22c [Rhinophrynus dorsalis]
MILYACVVRFQDGLPLSASTDFHQCKRVLACKKRLKTLSLTISRQPARGTAVVHDLSIHFCSAADISSLTICSSVYPSAMAFSFLDELLWEFSTSYNRTAIALASRPYAFLEFDSVIQRVKHNFNNGGMLPPCLDLSPLPVLVKLEESEEPNGILNGYANSHVLSAPSSRLMPVSTLGILSLTLNIMCSALSLIRGVHLVEHSFQEGYENTGRVIAFLMSFSANLLQCYLYLFYCPARKLKACGLLAIIFLCNLYLHGLRNWWQILFHVLVASLSTQQTLTRKPIDKPRDCGV